MSFYSCSPGSGAAAPESSRVVASSLGRAFTVDLHCHMFVAAAAEAVAGAFELETDGLHRFSNEATREVNARQADVIRGQLTDVDRRLADMDEMGIDVQALSPVPLQYYYALEPDLGRTAARLINDEIAVVAAAHPDRFVGLGGLPMQSPDMAVAELERVVKELGFKGIELSTNVNGEELSHEKFRRIFAKAEELDILETQLQYYYALEPDLGRTAARLINDEIAVVAAAHPDRFVGLGGLPMQSPDMAVAELERVVKELGFKGIELSTNVNGEELSAEKFRRIFAKAEELDILIFLHPNGFSDGARLRDHYFINVIGNPLDSTVAVHHLIFDGVLDSYPNLKICVAHGGGYLPAYSGRIDHAHAAREDCRRHIEEPPTSYLRRLYFDTVVFTEHQLEYLVGLYGSDHIVLGTDYPFDMGMDDPVGFVAGTTALTQGDKEAIVGANAARLLNISR